MVSSFYSRGARFGSPEEILMRLFSSWKKRWTRKSSTHNRRFASRIFRPRLELLEDRTVPSQFLVTSNLDDGSAGTLRAAITQANASVGADEIVFDPIVF